MRTFQFLFLIVISSNIFCQQLTVTEAKNVEIIGFEKVKIGDQISKKSHAIVKENGVLKLEDSLGFQIFLLEGEYDIDSTFNKILKANTTTDAFNKIANANIIKYFPNGLTEDETYICGTMRARADSNYIRSHYLANNALYVSNSINNSNVMNVSGDTISFFIEDSKKEGVTYFYHLSNLWEECIAFEKIEENTFTIYSNRLPVDEEDMKLFFLTIYTSDSRKSYKIFIGD